MKNRIYTLLYIGVFLGYLTGCASKVTVRDQTETSSHSDSLRYERRDSLSFRQLQQKEWAMNMRLQHLSFSSPDSSGQQYVENITYVESVGIKKENASTLLSEENQAQTQIGNKKTMCASEAIKAGKGGVGALWWSMLPFVLVFIVLIKFCYPVVKQRYDKIVSK